MAEPRSNSNSNSGMHLKEAHFPGRAPIDAYGNGGFRFADMSHKGSILCLPTGIYGWNVATAKELSVKNLSKLLEEAADIEILLLGTGVDLVPIGENLRVALRNAGISGDAMSTGAAVRTFNVLLAEGRAVSAALLAVN